jgi:hypothetical protein
VKYVCALAILIACEPSWAQKADDAGPSLEDLQRLLDQAKAAKTVAAKAAARRAKAAKAAAEREANRIAEDARADAEAKAEAARAEMEILLPPSEPGIASLEIDDQSAALIPHYFDMREARDGHYCDGRGQYMLWHQAPEVPGGVLRGVSRAAPDYALGRVNHYFTRSRAHWQAKLARGYPSDFLIRKQEEFDQYNRNEIADPAALRRVGALRQAVARLRHSSAG